MRDKICVSLIRVLAGGVGKHSFAGQSIGKVLPPPPFKRKGVGVG